MNNYIFEVSLEIKEDKEFKNLNESVYVVDSRTSANTNFEMSFNKKQNNFQENNKQEMTKIIIKNYLDYYYRNFQSINKFKIYKEISDSLIALGKKDNNNTENLDIFIILNKLFGIYYDNNDNNDNEKNHNITNSNIFNNSEYNENNNNNMTMNMTMNLNNNNNKISFSRKIAKGNKSLNFFGKKETINIEEELLKSENLEFKNKEDISNNNSNNNSSNIFSRKSNLKKEENYEIPITSNEKFIDKKIKNLFSRNFENTFSNHKNKSFLTLMNFSIGVNYFMNNSNNFNLVKEYLRVNDENNDNDNIKEKEPNFNMN